VIALRRIGLICTPFVTAVFALCAFAHAGDPAPTSPKLEPINFARDIQPILSDNCFSCHGPDPAKRQAELRLDSLDPKQGPFAPRDGYSVVSPGNLDDSVLIMRITSDEEDVHMPPAKSNRHLTDKQIELLKRWVEQGAKWGTHWSLEVPVREEVPAANDRTWPRNAIDRFVLAKLEKEGLKPSPEASKESLIRRVTLDLSGLPPTPAEVDAYLADPSSDAYEKVVDRLLASPRYGERMAWEWLEAARYADTNGYQNDPVRTMWPWRDWVVRAMNGNLPFDQFAIWQLAGDLIPSATRDQRLASAFNRNHPFNGEGGRIPEETRVENVMDRTDTTATVFLGLTVGCAKCHDHKFDPISQKEYYQLYAYFNQCSETGEGQFVNGGNALPVMNVSTTEQDAKLAELTQKKKAADEKLTAALPTIDQHQAKWEETARYEKGWVTATPVSAKSTGGATMRTQGDSSVLVSGTSADTDVYDVVLRSDLPRVTGLRIEVLPDASLPLGGPGRSPESGNFALTNIEATAVAASDPGQTKKLSFSRADATFSQANFAVANAIDADPKSAWAVMGAPDKNNVSAIFRLGEAVTFSGGTEIRLRLHFDSTFKQHTMGRFRIALTDGSAATPAVAMALATEPEQRSEQHKKQIRDFYRDRISSEYKPLGELVTAAKKELEELEKTLTRVMVMNDAKYRQSHVLVKGAYDKTSDMVDPGVPTVLNRLPTDQKNDRLALATWMFDPANPLTARVTVNRYWQQFFGIGIVKTVDDFGVQGERPVNPGLLDWLAVEFRDKGWNVKAMQRLMVTSAAYRQASHVTPELFERDPENRLLARGPRFRLPAAVIRDQALAASGLLVEKVGGAPVKPYQPAGVWEEATFGTIKYEQDHGEALYRRTAYVFWRRIVGPTGLFDAASRSVCNVRPSRTNTPLHALTTLNDITYVEAARCMAQRIMTGANESPDKRLDIAYRLLLSRAPSAKERTILLAALDRLKKEYSADKPAATKLLAVGESKRDEKLDPVEHAAYTGLCLEILNLDEALTKE
jgi:hypothetical protein